MIYVYYHRDMDGVLSALILSAINESTNVNAKFNSINYGELPNIEEDAEKLVFLDFFPDDRVVEKALSLGVSVDIYDHHEGRELKNKSDLVRLINHVGKATCVYLLWYLGSVGLESDFRKLVDLIGRRDIGLAWSSGVREIDKLEMNLWHDIVLKFFKEKTILLNKGNHIHQENMLRWYEIFKRPSTWSDLYYAYGSDVISDYKNLFSLAKKGKFIKIKNNSQDLMVFYIDCSKLEQLNYSELGNMAAKKYGCACVMHTPTKSRFSVRTTDDSRISALEVATLFGGGGHRNAAGFHCDNFESFLT